LTWNYGTLASEVYELDKPIGHSFGDVEYYTRALAGTDGPVLEPAVGTGRMLIPLLQAGLQVEGYDVSLHMLAICRDHCAERGLDPVLHEASMTTFTAPGRYAAIVLPVGSFGLVTGWDAALTALGCFRDSPACLPRQASPASKSPRPTRTVARPGRTTPRGPSTPTAPDRPQLAVQRWANTRWPRSPK
jgi:hypothetical protein